MSALKVAQEESELKIEELNNKVKALEQENLQKDQEISSLTFKLNTAEEENAKYEEKIKELKGQADTGAASVSEYEALQRKIALLEEEAEVADKNLRETNEKYGFSKSPSSLTRFGTATKLPIKAPDTFLTDDERRKHKLLSKTIIHTRIS